MKRKAAVALIVMVLLAAAGFAAWWYFVRPQADETEQTTEQTVNAVEASEGSVRVTVEGPGSVSPARSATIRSGIGGIITSAREEGDRVTVGETIVRFDTSDLEASIRQAELNLTQARLNDERAQSDLEQARAALEKTRRLADSGASTRDQLEQAERVVANAEFAVRAAALAVEQSELALDGARTSLEQATVSAPFSGVIIDSNVAAGDMVSSGAALVELADLSRVRIEAEVDEYDIGKVEIGMRVTVTGDALGDEPRSSRVELISPDAVVVNNIPIFTVTAIVDNADGRLRPGMNTDLTIMISSDKGIVVPSKAVSTVRSRSYVEVYADGTIETRRVTVGADDGISAAVVEGLEAGELVVLPTVSTLTLTSGADTADGSSIIPINVPGTGGSR